MAGNGTKTPNDDRSDTLNPNNDQNQAARDEHSRRLNQQEPRNAPEATRPSSLPGKGKGKGKGLGLRSSSWGPGRPS